MNEDLVLLRHAIEEPVPQMLLAEVASPTHARQVSQQIEKWKAPSRSLLTVDFDANHDDAATLWQSCHDVVASWDKDDTDKDDIGLLVLSDRSTQHVRIAHGTTQTPTNIGFWRTMNQLREKWDALPTQTVFLVTRDQYFFLTTEADHFKRWIPLKLHLPGPAEAAPQHRIAPNARAADESLTAFLVQDDLEDKKASRQNWDAYQERLRQALRRGESAQVLARRYYLPLMAAAITLGKLSEAANFSEKISRVALSPSEQLRWLRLRSRLEEAQGDNEEAVATAEKRLRLAEELEKKAQLERGTQKRELPHNVLSALNDLFILQNECSNYKEAKKWILEALSIVPDSADLLGNYAMLLDVGLKNSENAEKTYLQAIEADPLHTNNLNNYADFSRRSKQDYDKAEELYLRALEVDPEHTKTLHHYAVFLDEVRQGYEKAETFYLNALQTDFQNSRILADYADFLKIAKKNYEKADEIYLCAHEADPKDIDVLDVYSVFLCLQRHDFDRAAIYFRRAMEIDPNNAQRTINCAALSLMQGQKNEGKAWLDKAAAMLNLSDAQQVAIAFYRFMHFPEENPLALHELKELLQTTKRAENWTFDLNIERAETEGHPNVALLKALAAVIVGDETLTSLDSFPEWEKA